MPERREISKTVARQLLIESGHRCAACGTPFPLERAHIVPFHKGGENVAENLICLCANCHARADQERWPEDVLRSYKKRPFITRQLEPATSPPESKAVITVELQLGEEQIATDLKQLQSALAAFLKISPENVRLHSIKKG